MSDIFDEWYAEIASEAGPQRPVTTGGGSSFDRWYGNIPAAEPAPTNEPEITDADFDAWAEEARQALGDRNVGDYTRALGIGLDKFGQLIGRGLDVAGMDETGQAIEKYYGDRAEKLKYEQSQSFKSEQEKRFFTEDDDGTTHMGPAWKSAPKILGSIMGSLPSTAAGMGGGVAIAGGLIKLGVSSGLAGIIGGAVSEGGMSGAESAKDIYDMVIQAPIDQLSQTDEFSKAYTEAAANQSLDEDQLVKAARESVAKNAAIKAGAAVAGSTALLGAPSGHFLGKIVGGETGRTLPGTIVKQGGLEFLQEAPQSVAEKMVSNVAEARYSNPKTGLFDDVGEAAAEGGLVGLVTGGTMGSLAHNQGKINLLKKQAPPSDLAAQLRATVDDTPSGDGTISVDTPAPQGGFGFPAHDPEEMAAMEQEIVQQRRTALAGPNGDATPLQVQNQAEIDRYASEQAAAEQDQIRQAQQAQGLGKTGEVPGQGVDQARQAQELLYRAGGLPVPEQAPDLLALPLPEGIDPNAIALPYITDDDFDVWAAEIEDGPMEAPAGAKTAIPMDKRQVSFETVGEAYPYQSGDMTPVSDRPDTKLLVDSFPYGQSTPIPYEKQQRLLPEEKGFVLVDPAEPSPVTALAGQPSVTPTVDQNIEKINDSVVQNDIQAAVQEAATSPTNDLTEPTEAQKQAGNYKKGHIKVQGLDISIENPDGSTRSGTAPDGTPWETTMHGQYGYFKRTEGKDGDQVDVVVGLKPKTADPVFVIDQVDPETGKFDEHKVIMGVQTEQEARDLYLSNYEPGWKGLGAITQMHVLPFKKWLASGETKKPVGKIQRADQPRVEAVTAPAQAGASETNTSPPSIASVTVSMFFQELCIRRLNRIMPPICPTWPPSLLKTCRR